MAGIGFELRKYLEKGTYLDTLKAYTYAGIISAGPWILSILGVMLVGILSVSLQMEHQYVHHFLISVTWLMMTSLITTGAWLLLFVRFVADRLYEKAENIILANVVGLLLVSTAVTGTLSAVIMLLFFQEQSILYKILMTANFTTLCNMWSAIIFTSGMKQYRQILFAFLLGYLIMICSAPALHMFGLEGLLTGLLMGHSTILFYMLVLIFRQYPGSDFVRFDFLYRKNIKLRLLCIGIFYSVGIWIDKLLFWMTPHVSEQVIGPLRDSMIYDLPIFLAYISIIPGMAVFLVKIETDFVETYDRYFQAVREGETLQEIEKLSRDMHSCVNEALLGIVKVQGLTVVMIFLLAPSLISWLNISPYYLNLFCIDIIAVALQVILLSVLNVLFYLDRLTTALQLTLTLMAGNAFLTWASLQFGPAWYGTGFCASMLLSSIIGLYLLNRTFAKLNYFTFMLRI